MSATADKEAVLIFTSETEYRKNQSGYFINQKKEIVLKLFLFF